ncbi:response regulator [Neobacillus sp. LXY-1]|uniref:response regulator n=1 Tax=Neobacillus sp. LXY-1 TaxID=3379133 RepID=UPI003EE0F6E5
MRTALIVDDSAFMRNIVRKTIEQHFHVIAEGCDGREAISLYKKFLPDVVLLDLTMPHVDGLLALREIMNINPLAKVVVFSAWGTKFTIMEAIQLGAKDFIMKPHFEQLLPALRKLFIEEKII